jgi:hypothetical protein
MNHEERIGKFIQYLLENDYDEVQLSFDDEVSSVNYLVAANTKRGDFFWRAFEFLPGGDIVENFSDVSSDFVDDIYPHEQEPHPLWQKVVERLHELGDKADEVEFKLKPFPNATIYLVDGTIDQIFY